jgi:hypothetical protein
MGLEDPGTLKYLSEEVLGKTIRKEKIEGTPWWRFWGPKVASRYQLRETWLMDQNQCADVLNPATEQLICKPFGLPPMILRIAKYYVELPVSKHEPARSHRENRLKSLTRSIYNRRRARVEERRAFRAFVSARQGEQSKPAPVLTAAAQLPAPNLEIIAEPEHSPAPGMTRTQAVFYGLLHPERGSFQPPELRTRAHDAFALDIARGMSAGELCEKVMKSKEFTMPERRELLKALMEAFAASPGHPAKAESGA